MEVSAAFLAGQGWPGSEQTFGRVEGENLKIRCYYNSKKSLPQKAVPWCRGGDSKFVAVGAHLQL